MVESRTLITRDQITYSLDKDHPCALEIDSGTTLTFETWDARSGTIQRDEDLLDHPHPVGSNPATGPVAVRNAEPGDGLWNSYVSTSTLVVRHVNRHTNMGIPPVQLCERTDLCESLADIKDPTVWARERAV